MAYSKYSAKPTIVDGIRFASKAEARRFCELKALEQGRVIEGLELQPRFPLIVNSSLVCTYVGDFRYMEKGKSVVEDVKGFRTPEYAIKRKLLLALHPGMDHREIGVKPSRGHKPVSAEIIEIFRDAQRKGRAA